VQLGFADIVVRVPAQHLHLHFGCWASPTPQTLPPRSGAPATAGTRRFRLFWTTSCHVTSAVWKSPPLRDRAALRSSADEGWPEAVLQRSARVRRPRPETAAAGGGAGRAGRGLGGGRRPASLALSSGVTCCPAPLTPARRRGLSAWLPRPGAGPGSRVAPHGSRSRAATVATVAAAASRTASAALGVVAAGPGTMTGQGQSAASGSSAWSSIFRHVRYENLVAGVSGGVLSNLALHPLDLVKIRFAVSDGLELRPKYKGILHCLTTIWKLDGLRGLYQGVTPNVWGAGLSWGLYFFFYNAIKSYKTEGRTERLEATEYLISAAEAGIYSWTIWNITWCPSIYGV
uniref:Solute carrier family 25 member 32 n=2 Tax=Canis lupus TaxID=9612 RepID=A0A8C0QMY8_CANLF